MGFFRKKVVLEKRVVHCTLHNEKKVQKYASNKISTTKYTWYSYLPKALYEQFRRIANIYFAFHAGLSLTPISPVLPITTILPLVFVIGVAMVKELLEDIKRAQSDKEVNNRKVDVLTGAEVFETRSWRDLRVGDIVCVQQDTFFPADLLFLSSSDPEGTCYVETMNLDGETNLKLRKCLEVTKGLKNDSLHEVDSAALECELPNPSLYTFVGNLFWTGHVHSIGPPQMLLRGSQLRNTKHVYGMVVFTGHETKIQLNARNPPSKRSAIERRLDKIILFQLTLLFSMSLLTSVIFAIWLSDRTRTKWYLRTESKDAKDSITAAQFNRRGPFVAGILQFFTSLVLYGYFMPISLYVSIEVVKIIQAKFISTDKRMYYEPAKKAARARTSNLNEELGMIRTILSDKTGTLTRNEMEFFKVSIAGVAYGKGVTEVEMAAAARAGRPMRAAEIEDMGKAVEKGYNLRDPRLEELSWQGDEREDVIRRFLEVLAVCHTVVPEGEAKPGEIKYMAESPDEHAFVVAAKRLGLFFYKRSASHVHVKELKKWSQPVETKYEVLNTIEFTSHRKRMSVVVRDPDQKLLLLCKGADTVILERLSEEGSEFRDATAAHMTEFAEAGLRTLAIAYAELDENFYAQWQSKWLDAKSDITSAAAQSVKLEALAELIEQNLTLLGATAIEDKLQAGVPQAIANLAEAGIKLWVLTGDKLETAINIGYACSLLRQSMVQHIVRLEDAEFQLSGIVKDEGVTMEEAGRLLVLRQVEAGIAAVKKDHALSTGVDHAIVIDGKALVHVLSEKDTKQRFLDLALSCKSVICCRVSPKQKAVVTTLVRKDAGEICLGIGDGANDVGMIQAANIGVGISGVEGQQAVMASDFSIAQFRFLERLVLVHGGWSYKRVARMITYFFYKCFTFGFTVFFYNGLALFSGQSIYWDWFLSLFNVIFSCLPVCVVACTDKDVSAKNRLRFPALYLQGQRNSYFTVRAIASWMLNGLLQAIIIFSFVILAYRVDVDRSSGKNVWLYAQGVTMYSCVIWAVNIQIGVMIQYWTWMHHLVIWGTILAWYIFLLLLDLTPRQLATQGIGLFTDVAGASFSYYFIVLLTVCAALLPDFLIRSTIRNYFPEDHHIVQEIEMLDRVERRRGSQREADSSADTSSATRIHSDVERRRSSLTGLCAGGNVSTQRTLSDSLASRSFTRWRGEAPGHAPQGASHQSGQRSKNAAASSSNHGIEMAEA